MKLTFEKENEIKCIKNFESYYCYFMGNYNGRNEVIDLWMMALEIRLF